MRVEDGFFWEEKKGKEVICPKHFTFVDGKKILLMRYLIVILLGVVSLSMFAQNVDSECVSGLKELRQQIDSIDNELMRTLANRMEVCVAVGKYKKEHKIAVVQTNRFSELVERLCKDGTAMGLSEDFIVKVMNLIHEESVRQQKQLMQEQKGKTVIVYYDVSVGTTAIEEFIKQNSIEVLYRYNNINGYALKLQNGEQREALEKTNGVLSVQDDRALELQ